MQQHTELLPPEVLNLLRTPRAGVPPSSLQGRLHHLLTTKGELTIDEAIVGLWEVYKFVPKNRVQVNSAINRLVSRGLAAKKYISDGTMTVPVWRVV